MVVVVVVVVELIVIVKVIVVVEVVVCINRTPTSRVGCATKEENLSEVKLV